MRELCLKLVYHITIMVVWLHYSHLGKLLAHTLPLSPVPLPRRLFRSLFTDGYSVLDENLLPQ
jgi:hypothetical protein